MKFKISYSWRAENGTLLHDSVMTVKNSMMEAIDTLYTALNMGYMIKGAMRDYENITVERIDLDDKTGSLGIG